MLQVLIGNQVVQHHLDALARDHIGGQVQRFNLKAFVLQDALDCVHTVVADGVVGQIEPLNLFKH